MGDGVAKMETPSFTAGRMSISASGAHAIPISEHIFAFLLAFARDLRHS